MNLLTRILAIDVPANTSLVFPPAFTFRGFSLGWVIALILIVLFGVAMVVFFNLLEKGTLGWFRRIVLISLRATLLFLLLFLILRPVLLAEFVGQRPNGVALLIDDTQSMQQRDRRLTVHDKARVALALNKRPLADGLTEKLADLPNEASSNPSRKDLVVGVLKHPDLKLVEGLQKYGPLRPYRFGADVQGLQDSESAKKKDLAEKLVVGYEANDTRTSLADSILKILQSKDGDPPSAIVVVTDGQDNASKFTLQEAALKCREANVPLHIYGVGSSEGGQLQLKEVSVPEALFAEDSVAIPMRWRAQGFKQGTVEIVATLGGKEVVKKKVNLQTGEDLRDVLSFIVPKDLPKNVDKQDSQKLVTTIKYQSGAETFKDEIAQWVRVVDSKIRLLYIEHSPRWEFKFLQPMLLRDRRIHNDVSNPDEAKRDRMFLLVNAVKEVAEKAPYLPEFPKTREKFLDAKYNLIILGDVSANYFSKEQQDWLKEFVQKGGGLIVLSGRQNMPASYENTPLAEMLPVEFKKEKQGLDTDVRTQEYPATLTVEGQRTPWLALADTPEENLEVWQKKLPGFHWNYPVTKLKPAATSLVVNPRLKIGETPNQQPMPILATHNYGRGQVIWLGTDETWRWRWNWQDKYFVRLWGQLIYQAGLPNLLGDASKRAQLALEHSQAMVNKPGRVFVRLLDKDFNPRKDATVEAEMEYPDARPVERLPVTLKAIPGRPGEYAAFLTHDRPGRVNLTVKNPDVNTFTFRVDLPPKHELEEAGLAEKALRDAAELSGGRFYREEDLRELTSQLSVKTTEFRRRNEILLWNPLAILLFLGLLTTEWLVRKFSDLS